MSADSSEDKTIYEVVINHEEQYSIWPADMEVPKGWKTVGKSGLKQECLDYVEEVWTDMRPLSLRKHMEEMAKNPPPAPEAVEEPDIKPLPERLAEGEHEVEVGLRPEKTPTAFREAIERGYVHVKFTRTRGGTELGFELDKNESKLDDADFDKATGQVKLVGSLTLDYVPVKCIADIDLSTLAGKGRLEILAA